MVALVIATAIQLFSYTNVPVTEMRDKPCHDTTIVSSTYYSEEVCLLEEAGDWAKIQTSVDAYQGWVKKASLISRQDALFTNPASTIAKVNRLIAHVFDREDTEYGPILTLPFDSRLEVLEPKGESNSRWLKVALLDGKIGYIQRGDVTFSSALLSIDEVCQLSKTFLGLPYYWGGRSSRDGYDCSGFTQMLYRKMGIFIPRDSKDQTKWSGFAETAFDKLQPGDLIFFGLAQDNIRHVGMSLGDDTFIHSTKEENRPYIRLSFITDAEWSGHAPATYPYRTARTLKPKN